MSYKLSITIEDAITRQKRVWDSGTVSPISDQVNAPRIDVSTTEITISFPTTAGRATLRNRGTTDVISVGFATGVYLFEIPPGESCTFRRTLADAAQLNLFVVSTGTTDKANLEAELRDR